MKFSILSQQNKAARNLESLYNNFLRDFNKQLSSMNVDQMYQEGTEKFTKFIEEAEIKLKKEQEKFKQSQALENIKTGSLFKNSYCGFQKWYATKAPSFYVWADDKFTSVECYVENTFNQSGLWVKSKVPAVKGITGKKANKRFGFNRNAGKMPFKMGRTNKMKYKRSRS